MEIEALMDIKNSPLTRPQLTLRSTPPARGEVKYKYWLPDLSPCGRGRPKRQLRAGEGYIIGA